VKTSTSLILLVLACALFIGYGSMQHKAMAQSKGNTQIYTAMQGTSQHYIDLAAQDANDAGIPSDLFIRQIREESGFHPDVISRTGAIGIAQFEPDTAAGIGLDPHDPVASLKAAAHLMATYYRRYGDYAKALSAYNAGPGRTNWAIQQGGASWRQYIPKETNAYINSILD
jgi:soluble lytic murein transglycosylase-like protein